MKKLMAVSTAILIAAGAISVNAAGTSKSKINFNDILDSVKEKGIYEDIFSEEKGCVAFGELLELIKKCRPDMELPDFNLPDFNFPNLELPDFIKPEDTPETDEPDTDIPDTDIPDADIPENEAPDADAPVIPEEKPESTPDSTPETDNGTSEDAYVNEVLKLVNQYRASNGLSPVSLDNAICSAAEVRAREIKSSFSHTRPNGSSCFTVLSEAGISYNGAGENIAYGQSSPSEVMTAWMNSEGHRANILNGSFTKLGVGVYSSGGTLYWTQLFTY